MARLPANAINAKLRKELREAVLSANFAVPRHSSISVITSCRILFVRSRIHRIVLIVTGSEIINRKLWRI